MIKWSNKEVEETIWEYVMKKVEICWKQEVGKIMKTILTLRVYTFSKFPKYLDTNGYTSNTIQPTLSKQKFAVSKVSPFEGI